MQGTALEEGDDQEKKKIKINYIVKMKEKKKKSETSRYTRKNNSYPKERKK